MKMERVLVLSPHPDDEILGLGGTLLHCKQLGAAVFVCCITDGVSARHDLIGQQKERFFTAMEKLGVSGSSYLGLPDQKLDVVPLVDILKPVEKIVSDFQPDTIFFPTMGDVNQDHRRCHEAGLVLSRPTPQCIIRNTLCYEVPSSSEWYPAALAQVFAPNYFVDISRFIDRKIQMLSVYDAGEKGEIRDFPHPRSYEAVRVKARQTGVMIGVEYAEAFQILRAVEK